MRRRAIIIATWGALASVIPCQGGRAGDGAMESPEAAAPPYAGPLGRAPSAAYVPLRPGAPVRSGPSPSSPVVSALPAATKPLQALGMVVEAVAAPPPDGRDDPALARTWIKLRLPSGETGFASLGDLITPRQAEARAGSLRKVGLFEADVAAAKRTGGPDMPSGIYTQGGSCDAPASRDAEIGAFLQSKVLIWQQGSKLHFVRVLRPDDPTVYDIRNDSRVQELRGFGYVPMRTFTSAKDAALMGFKDHRLWVSPDGQVFNAYEICDPGLVDATLSLLRSYAGQRPPEGH